MTDTGDTAGRDGLGRPLPSPNVRFEPEFRRRVAALSVRRRRVRARGEGAGRAWASGGGFEFTGYRPYRAGEDVRTIDWTVAARDDRPYVRTTRREQTSRAHVALDTSASMGIGPPGKLQRAAEVALAWCALALEVETEVEFRTTNGTRRLLRRSADWEALLHEAEGWCAGGREGLATLLNSARLNAGRWLLVGDLADVEPAEVAQSLARTAGRIELDLVQVLAPVELDPPDSPFVEWFDPESTERLTVALDRTERERWAQRLDAERDAWRRLCRVRRGAFAGGPTTRPFERWIEELDRWTGS